MRVAEGGCFFQESISRERSKFKGQRYCHRGICNYFLFTQFVWGMWIGIVKLLSDLVMQMLAKKVDT
jgi:hypothetical protein